MWCLHSADSSHGCVEAKFNVILFISFFLKISFVFLYVCMYACACACVYVFIYVCFMPMPYFLPWYYNSSLIWKQVPSHLYHILAFWLRMTLGIHVFILMAWWVGLLKLFFLVFLLWGLYFSALSLRCIGIPATPFVQLGQWTRIPPALITWSGV